jgi:hypothetical protein
MRSGPLSIIWHSAAEQDRERGRAGACTNSFGAELHDSRTRALLCPTDCESIQRCRRDAFADNEREGGPSADDGLRSGFGQRGSVGGGGRIL